MPKMENRSFAQYIRDEKQNGDGLFTVTSPSGQQWLLKPLPKLFYTFYGELPNYLTVKAAQALKSDESSFVEAELLKTLTPAEVQKTLLMMREAIICACVSPCISLKPQSEDEISLSDLTVEDFKFLADAAMKSYGIETQIAVSFADNEANLLRVALQAKHSGKEAHEIIGITDETLALDFNQAASFRLEIYESKKQMNLIKGMNLAALSANAGEVLKFEGDDDNSIMIIGGKSENYLNFIPEAP